MEKIIQYIKKTLRQPHQLSLEELEKRKVSLQKNTILIIVSFIILSLIALLRSLKMGAVDISSLVLALSWLFLLWQNKQYINRVEGEMKERNQAT